MTQTRFCPYKGLEPYDEEFQDYFFGREQDTKTIAANLATTRLTVLYGVSGVGKTSVLQAGVVPFLLQKLPNVIVVVFREWQDDNFLLSLKTEITNAVERTGQSFSANDEPLDDLLARAAYATRSTFTIILDQFEEYFLYHPITEDDNHFDTKDDDHFDTKDDNHFDAEFARAVNRDEVDANFLLSIREDNLASLDRFQGRIPNLLKNYLRLEHLDHEAVGAAILRPIGPYNDRRATDEPEVRIEAEDEFVEEMIEQLKATQFVSGEAGRGVVKSRSSRSEVSIEAPYLQLVMIRLWNEATRTVPCVISVGMLKRLGGAKGIVQEHLDNAMNKLSTSEKETAARVFHHLVTPSGAKIAHTAHDLAKYAELDQDELPPILNKLSGGETRILRSVTGDCYEIFHDVLAPAILGWRSRFVLRQNTRRRRIKGILIAVTIFIVSVIVGLFVYTIEQQKAEARIEFVRWRLQNLVPSFYVPSGIALTLTSSDIDFIESRFQAGQTDSIGEEEEEEEEEEKEEAPISTPLSLLGELVEATYRLRLLKNDIGFVPESLTPDRFQKISSHEHYRVGGDVKAYFEVMETLGIQKVVFFPTGLPPNNNGYHENMEDLLSLQELYSQQIIAFCTVDEGDLGAPAILEDCLKKGGRGLKLIGGHPDFYELDNPLNSPTMMQVFEIADEHDVPVVIHINMVKFPELQSQLEHILQTFSDVPFVAAHYCKDDPPFELCAHLLDTYSNLYTDLSMGGALDRYLADISIHRDDYRNFILQYQDRILWGTDLIVDDSETKTADFFERRISYDLYLLETGSQYDPTMKETFQSIPKGAFALEDVQLFGLDLHEETLKKIYWDNPHRILNLPD